MVIYGADIIILSTCPGCHDLDRVTDLTRTKVQVDLTRTKVQVDLANGPLYRPKHLDQTSVRIDTIY